jgi:DNA-binding response OmpR family regulator
MREPRLFLIESNTTIRAALQHVLSADGHHVVTCDSLARLMAHAPFAERDLALLAWQCMDGLLSQKHRQDMVQLAGLLPIVLIVPRQWLRLLNPIDLSATALLPKPFDPEELRTCVQHILGTEAASRSASLAHGGR